MRSPSRSPQRQNPFEALSDNVRNYWQGPQMSWVRAAALDYLERSYPTTETDRKQLLIDYLQAQQQQYQASDVPSGQVNTSTPALPDHNLKKLIDHAISDIPPAILQRAAVSYFGTTADYTERTAARMFFKEYPNREGDHPQLVQLLRDKYNSDQQAYASVGRNMQGGQ